MRQKNGRSLEAEWHGLPLWLQSGYTRHHVFSGNLYFWKNKSSANVSLNLSNVFFSFYSNIWNIYFKHNLLFTYKYLITLNLVLMNTVAFGISVSQKCLDCYSHITEVCCVKVIKYHTERSQSAMRIKPWAFLVRGKSANHWTTVSPLFLSTRTKNKKNHLTKPRYWRLTEVWKSEFQSCVEWDAC